MPWNGLGTYELDPDYSPEFNGEIIDADRYNGLHLDVAAGISNAIAKDGQNVPIANLPMGNFKHIHCAPATKDDEYVILAQLIQSYNLTVPQVVKNQNATLDVASTGWHWYHSPTDTASRVWTIPAQADVDFYNGHVTTFVNDNAVYTVTIQAAAGVTLFLVGSYEFGNVLIEPGGACTLLRVGENRWAISGKGTLLIP